MSHENNFASYVETLIPDDLRDNNLLTDLPQKSRRYDVANSRYHCSKFIYAVEALTQADDFTYIPMTANRLTKSLRGRLYILHSCIWRREGEKGEANLGSDFKRP